MQKLTANEEAKYSERNEDWLRKPKQRLLEIVQTTESFSPCIEAQEDADARAKVTQFHCWRLPNFCIYYAHAGKQ